MTSGSRSKVRHLRQFGIACALTSLLGCGGGGSSSTVSGPVGGGNSNPVLPPTGNPVNLNFTVANFGGAQVATLVARNAPTSEGGSPLLATTTSNNRADPPTLNRGEAEEVPERDLPLALRQAEMGAVEQILARGEGSFEPPLQPKFQQLAKGDTAVFFITTSNLNVTCRKMNSEAESAHCTIFAEVVAGNPVMSEGVAADIIEAFDSNNPFRPGQGIYAQVRAIFGSEWSAGGGRDGDEKINIVFLSATSIGGNQFFGFFRPADEFSKAQFATSNEGEILYLNANRLSGDNFDILSTLAHEFQHCVSMNMKQIRQGSFAGSSENAAIDEGRAVLCEDLLGYSMDHPSGGNNFMFRSCRSFLQNPSRQGIFQFDGNLDGYGRNYTLMRYLLDRFGENQFRNYVQSTGVGLAQLQQSFPGFSDVFGDWALANLSSSLSGPVPTNLRFGPQYNPVGSYNIRGLGTTSLPGWTPSSQAAPPSGTQGVALQPWAAASLRYSNGSGNTLNVNLQGPAGLGGRLLVENPQGTFNGLR